MIIILISIDLFDFISKNVFKDVNDQDNVGMLHVNIG